MLGLDLITKPTGPRSRVIPAYVLVGFLGSGKTTVLSHLIEWCISKGLRPGVVLNEFGATWVDGTIINTNGLAMTELSNGCICCSASEDLLPAMIQLATRPDIDLILLESSGFANPADMLDELTAPFLWKHLEVGGVISIVDCTRVEALLGSGNLLVRQQIEFADLLVMNKCDLVNLDQQNTIQQHLSGLAPAAKIFEAERGLPYRGIEALLAQSLEIGRKRHQLQEHLKTTGLLNLALSIKANTTIPHYNDQQPHNHEFNPASWQNSINVLTFEIERPVDKAAFEIFLKNLPPNVYRAKGFVRVAGQDAPHVFQHLANFAQLLPMQKQPPALRGVFIGQGLDANGLEMQLLECQDKGADLN